MALMDGETLAEDADAQALDDSRWRAIQQKDRRAEGSFVYAVLTTGVYCRAGCPSRLPRFENVRFFEKAADAERVGFRPCKRCKPDQPVLRRRHAEAVALAAKLIEEADTPDFDAIAKKAGLSRHHFHRIFKEITGMTPGAYLRSARESRAMRKLSEGAKVTEAIYGAGYGSSSRFYETVGRKIGMQAGRLGKGGAGEAIHFAIGECSLGSLLVAVTAKGVCAIEFGDDPDVLLRAFEDRFPRAELIGGDEDFERLVSRIAGFADNPASEFGLPLHVRGTVFQHKVWRALMEIPPGRTMSYSELASAIGQPAAVRACASACANNALAVAIPCHRVVRTDGSLSGYRWGIERKAALLKKEAAGR